MEVFEPTPICFAGVTGDRYWVQAPFDLTGVPVADRALAGFPIAIFLPRGRSPAHTPLVVALQGLCAPYSWNDFIVPTLIQMGIAVALIETPLAGERSLSHSFSGRVIEEVMPLLDLGVRLDSRLIFKLFRCLVRDVQVAIDLGRDRYGLVDPRLALFGVSWGVTAAAHAFIHDRLGVRLLGAIGHADLPAMAAGLPYLVFPDLDRSQARRSDHPMPIIERPHLAATLPLLRLGKALRRPDDYAQLANPLTYLDRLQTEQARPETELTMEPRTDRSSTDRSNTDRQASPLRRARFLVGDLDSIVAVGDANHCAELLPQGACYVVPGLGHGTTTFGPSFVDHVRYFLATQLGDWQ